MRGVVLVVSAIVILAFGTWNPYGLLWSSSVQNISTLTRLRAILPEERFIGARYFGETVAELSELAKYIGTAGAAPNELAGMYEKARQGQEVDSSALTFQILAAVFGSGDQIHSIGRDFAWSSIQGQVDRMLGEANKAELTYIGRGWVEAGIDIRKILPTCDNGRCPPLPKCIAIGRSSVTLRPIVNPWYVLPRPGGKGIAGYTVIHESDADSNPQLVRLTRVLVEEKLKRQAREANIDSIAAHSAVASLGQLLGAVSSVTVATECGDS